ncbi:MAG: M28 family peptidase [Oscillospiraceae bacterium]|jgi:acetylornithine deacetylase/succinyl-diaminopimelate desuccinylase-like protein|nr:M28 family peptidase [Oscillospiraceae bacterium]
MKHNISEELVQYMLSGITEVCNRFKNRAPGTKSERDAQAHLKTELEGYADEVIMEDFTEHPSAFMGFIPVAALLAVASIALYWLNPHNGGALSWAMGIAAVALPFFAALMFVFEFLMYRDFVDFLFPKKISRNVYATYKPSGEVKKRIIFGGHTDAANEWTYQWLGGAAALAPVIFGGVLAIFYTLGINIARLASGIPDTDGTWKTLGWIAICTLPFIIAIMLFINYKIIVDGANDNLSANFISMAVIKDMHDRGVRFEHTEIGCFLSGSEEAGLRGAKAFAKKHKDDLTADGVETIFISLDTMTDVDQMMTYTRGCTGTVGDDKAVGDLLQEAGKNCGKELPIAGWYPGAVDAEAFSMYGLRACGFCALRHDPPPKYFYHTRNDNVEHLNPECLSLSLDICMEAAEIFDEKGMAPFDAARKKK